MRVRLVTACAEPSGHERAIRRPATRESVHEGPGSFAPGAACPRYYLRISCVEHLIREHRNTPAPVARSPRVQGGLCNDRSDSLLGYEPSALRSAAISSAQSRITCTHLSLSRPRRQKAFTPCMF